MSFRIVRFSTSPSAPPPSVSVIRSPPRQERIVLFAVRNSDRTWFSQLPQSFRPSPCAHFIPPAPSGDRRPTNFNTDRRLVEQSNLIKRALEASVLLRLYPRSRVEVTIAVLADDGGRLCAAVNAATLALVDAGVPMRDMVCACSAGVAAGGGPDGSDVEIVDLNRLEMTGGGGGGGGGGGVYLPCAAMPQRGTVVLAQCESRLPVETFEKVLVAAMDGCNAVFEVMQSSVRERAATLLAARNGNATVAVD
mmetsp:Transcript_54095/g.161945  ORF Transcript_54095/g.161945 Transcript_54095/m.161945 type:complete len:251 (-) Transcript_54095:717-1469(-)